MKGSEIRPGDAITFTPGNKPVRFVRIDPQQHVQAALGMTYRIGYDVADIGYALFDEASHQLIHRMGIAASEVAS